MAMVMVMEMGMVIHQSYIFSPFGELDEARSNELVAENDEENCGNPTERTKTLSEGD